MALTLLDHMRPSIEGGFSDSWPAMADRTSYMLHVGAGWALARLPWLRWRADAFLRGSRSFGRDGWRWMATASTGYFYWPRSVRRQRDPAGPFGYARRAFDQGLGRSLWFVEGADAAHIAAAISAFPQSRRADLWSGVGLASAYAGGVDRRRAGTAARGGRHSIFRKWRKGWPSPPKARAAGRQSGAAYGTGLPGVLRRLGAGGGGRDHR